MDLLLFGPSSSLPNFWASGLPVELLGRIPKAGIRRCGLNVLGLSRPVVYFVKGKEVLSHAGHIFQVHREFLASGNRKRSSLSGRRIAMEAKCPERFVETMSGFFEAWLAYSVF